MYRWNETLKHWNLLLFIYLRSVVFSPAVCCRWFNKVFLTCFCGLKNGAAVLWMRSTVRLQFGLKFEKSSWHPFSIIFRIVSRTIFPINGKFQLSNLRILNLVRVYVTFDCVVRGGMNFLFYTWVFRWCVKYKIE